jgi:ubiquinone/menaquinone biosynthesis C-methylase UbiE
MSPRATDRDELPRVDEIVPVGAVPPDYVERNRAAWNRWAVDYIATGRKAWTDSELRWGIWGIPESELELLAHLPEGSDVVELGCGTAAISAWVARAGLRPVAVDVSRAQLDVAARLQDELGPSFPLIHANAEQVPFDTESFDLVISEYGASLWCEPHRWLAEANRLLRPQGGLIFVTNSPLLMACTPESGERAGDRLLRDYFASPVREFPEDGVVEFHLTHGNWVRLLRAYGFTLERLVELRPQHGARPRFEFVSNEWARRWPSEEIWVARKAA